MTNLIKTLKKHKNIVVVVNEYIFYFNFCTYAKTRVSF